jgi:hypothetical protein
METGAPGSGRKQRLSPLQREVLWILEEAGAENLLTVLWTLRAHFPALEVTPLLGEAVDGLRRLWLAGLIEVSTYHAGPSPVWVPLGPDSAEQVWALLFALPGDSERWVWPGGIPLPCPEVVLTEAGRRSLTT